MFLLEYIFCLSRENKNAFGSSFHSPLDDGDDHCAEVKPPNLLFPADLINTKVLGILSHLEWKLSVPSPSIVAWYNFFSSFTSLFNLLFIAKCI